MHPFLLQEIARQRQEDLRRAARQYRPAGLRSHRPVTAARTIRPGGGPTRSKPRILAALLLWRQAQHPAPGESAPDPQSVST
jgi:hypothetical protein